MILTLAELVLPPLVVFTTLFGLLARGTPKPGGVSLFLRVGLVGLALAARPLRVGLLGVLDRPHDGDLAARVLDDVGDALADRRQERLRRRQLRRVGKAGVEAAQEALDRFDLIGVRDPRLIVERLEI